MHFFYFFSSFFRHHGCDSFSYSREAYCYYLQGHLQLSFLLHAPCSRHYRPFCLSGTALQRHRSHALYGVGCDCGYSHCCNYGCDYCPFAKTSNTPEELRQDERELDRVVPPDQKIELELCWEPPWDPTMISARGRAQMGW